MTDTNFAKIKISFLSAGIVCVGMFAGGVKAEQTNSTPTESLAPLSWGMSVEEVQVHFRNKLKTEYAPKLKKAGGAVEEDRMRKELNQALKKIETGVVEFSGKPLSWDRSFLRGEYQHKQQEAMLVIKDERSQNFYFFRDGQLWKWYKAYDASAFADKSFNEFVDSLHAKFGKSHGKQGGKKKKVEASELPEWNDRETRLRAVDQTKFYGVYGLVFDSKDVLKKRKGTSENHESEGHSLVDAIMRDENAEETDEHADVVDHLTGKRRARPVESNSTRDTKTDSDTTKNEPGSGLEGVDL